MGDNAPYKGRPYRSIAYGTQSTEQYKKPEPTMSTPGASGDRRSVTDSVSVYEGKIRSLHDRDSLPFFTSRKSNPTGSSSSSSSSGASRSYPERPVSYQVSAVAPGAEEYNMNHKRRGKCLIFNHDTFNHGNSPRQGSDVDAKSLHEQFRRLGFEVQLKNNLTIRRVLSTLYEVSREDHSDADCLAVIVMTHGEPGTLQAYDGTYKEKELWKLFQADKCPSLAGKPKLFFIQACRGDKVDDGVVILRNTTVTDGPSKRQVSYTIPATADLLMAYATYDGHYAWRNIQTGSWFIQALCQELSINGTQHDLLRILTSVNRRVATEYRSSVPGDKTMDQKKQMSNFISSLMRLVYFKPKHPFGVM